MSLTKEQFERLDRAVRDIEEILGEQTLGGIISVLAALKAQDEESNVKLFDNLMSIEAQDD